MKSESAHCENQLDDGYIDSIRLQLLVECDDGSTRAPYVTVLVARARSKPYAFSLSLQPPNIRSHINLLYECLLHQGQLPRSIYIDGSKEFQSIEFQEFLKFLTGNDSSLKQISLGNYQGMAFGERMLRTIQTWLLEQTALTADTSHSEGSPAYTLAQLEEILYRWVYEDRF
jgi:putative transposase